MFLENKKLAIITIANDFFIEGCYVMLHSLFNNGKITNFNFSSIDIIILNNKNNLGYPLILSDENFLLIKNKIHSFLEEYVSIKINQISELNLIYYDKIKKMRYKNNRLNASLYTFEIFSDYYLNNYDYILYCDSDILFINEISGKYGVWDILACNDIKDKYKKITQKSYNNEIPINGGFFIINTKKIKMNVTNKLLLLHINKEINNTEELADQGTINEYFSNSNLRLKYLKHEFMLFKGSFTKDTDIEILNKINEFTRNSTIIHYISNKPWEKTKRLNNYKNIEKIWLEYRDSLCS